MLLYEQRNPTVKIKIRTKVSSTWTVNFKNILIPLSILRLIFLSFFKSEIYHVRGDNYFSSFTLHILKKNDVYVYIKPDKNVFKNILSRKWLQKSSREKQYQRNNSSICNNKKKKNRRWTRTDCEKRPYEEKVLKSRLSFSLKRRLSFYKRRRPMPPRNFLKIQPRCIFISLHPETFSVANHPRNTLLNVPVPPLFSSVSSPFSSAWRDEKINRPGNLLLR